VLKEWYHKSPPGFLFSVRAPRIITNDKKTNDVESLLRDFYATVSEGLKDKLGPVVFQFPASLKYTHDRLAEFLERLDPSFGNVLEFRQGEWWQTPVKKMLLEKGVTFCGSSHPNLPGQVIPDKRLMYYRFHGVPKLHRSSYTSQQLELVANAVKQAKPKNAFIYFNNTAGAAAIRNALELIRIFSRSR
jgi:uncharacterized protein YecE (DUF72 family)